MGARQDAKDAYKALLEGSSGKSLEDAQDATLALIDIIADMVGTPNQVSTNILTSVTTNAPATGTGTQTGAQGTITIT